MKKLLTAFAMLLFVGGTLYAQPLWLRYNAISPKGDKIAFTYMGNIYVVDAQGGMAKQITTTTSYDYNPVWSNDGSKIAFASDRNGNFDVYVVGVEGGAAARVTTNSTAEVPMAFSSDDKYIYYTASLQKNAENAQFAAAWMKELYKAPVTGGRPELVTTATVCSVSFDKDGKSFLYYDRKGSENEWRKHQVSSVARDLVYYDAKKNTHTILTTNIGEDRDPRFVPGKNGEMVFLSERVNDECMNVFRGDYRNPQQAKQITFFEKYPVRFLTVANDGTLCFGYQGEIYTQKVDGKPEKVKIDIVNDWQNVPERGKFGRAGSIVMTPDGKQFAFVSRGEIFVTADEFTTTKQITNTAAAESSPSLAPDGRTLVYCSERDGYYSLYTAKIVRKEDPNFAYATLVKEERLFPEDGIERTYPQFSPNGKEIAFIESRSVLKVLNLDTKAVRQITDGVQHHGTTASKFSYQWSPDGKWFCLDLTTNGRDPYTDVGIVSAAGDMKIHNITDNGYITSRPRWAMDGNAIIFTSNRYGMRSHASWGSQNDAFVAFLNQDAYDRFTMSKEEYALLKQEEKAAKDLANKSDKKDDPKAKADAKKEDKPSKDIVVEIDGLDERIIRLTPMSSNVSSGALSKDGEKFYFIASFEKGQDLWEVDVRERGIKILKKGIGGGTLAFDDKGENLFLLSGAGIQKINTKSGNTTQIRYDNTMTLDHAAERKYMFDHIFLQQAHRYFNVDNHGADFVQIKKDFEPFLPHINNNYDFAELMSEVLGELNVSHSGSRFRGYTFSNPDATANFGVLFDINYKGDGLKVAEVLAGGPFDKKVSKLKAGDVIESIDGVKVTKDMDYFPLLNHKAGVQVLVGLYSPKDGKRWEELVKPISSSTLSNLMYERWVKHNAEMVDKLSNGQLGYVHIKGMNDASFRDIYSDILGKYNKRKGMVIDTRFNGGGRLHEDIEILFSGEKYLEQVIRGKVSCVMPSRRYVKPSIMLIGEANYSNAHGTPWVYNYKKMGKLVGMPVPGTMSTVTWEDLQDETLYFGLPVIGYRAEDGTYLENTQLEPDIKVRNSVEKLELGRDEQLEAAVKALLEDVRDFHYWGD